jgi:hypothetical protein
MSKRLIFSIFITILLSSCGTIKKLNLRYQQKKAKQNFHVYLLLGQSNMAGRGKIHAIDTVVHPRVYMMDQDTTWTLAKNPLHFDHPKAVGTGLGLTFGKKIAEKDSTIQVGLIPCAVGGTSIDNWFIDQFHEASQSFPYNEAVARIEEGREKGTIKGVLWHQGESDSKKEVKVESYKEKFLAFRDSLKKDLEIDVPFVIGEVGHFLYNKRPFAKNLNAVFQNIAENHNNIGLVKTDSLAHKGDRIHFDAKSYRTLGARYAKKMLQLQENSMSDNQGIKEWAIFDLFNQ